jgi:hypothetical protein
MLSLLMICKKIASPFAIFKNFNEIYLKCDQTYNFTYFSAIIFSPKNYILLDDQFNLRKIIRDNQTDNKLVMLTFSYIIGFDINFVFGDEQFVSFRFLNTTVYN